MHRIFACLLALAVFSALLAADRAAEGEARAKAVASYLDGQTLVVIHVDVTRVDVDAFRFAFGAGCLASTTSPRLKVRHLLV